MGHTAEYDIQVSLTEAFIATDPESIGVQRWGQYRDPATGGLVSGWSDPLPPQDVRIMEYSPAAQVHQVTTPDGDLVMPELYLLAMPDADLRKGDKFSWRGEDWRVAAVHPKPDYELRADLVVDTFG